MVPIAIVAGQARCFQSEDGTHLAIAYRRQQFSKTWPLLRACSRAAQIVVDHHHLAKLQLARLLRELVLAALAFQMFTDLVHGGLPDVDVSSPLQVCVMNLLAHRWRSFPFLLRLLPQPLAAVEPSVP